MKKRGFTLLEVIVSIVLVSVVMISLLASLIQLNETYNIIHENSDILVYNASVTRVINNDLSNNLGIRYISCNEDNLSCDFVLGNDSKRKIEIYQKIDVVDDQTNSSITHESIKSTIRYIKVKDDDEEELIYIKTLNMDKYTNTETGKVTTDGYSFLDIDTKQYEYGDPNPSGSMIDTFTTLTIRVYDGVNLDDNRYDIVIYTSGRYDYSNMIGKSFRISLDGNGATTIGTSSFDELFGVGYYRSESNHKKSDVVKKITIPSKGTEAFLGYFYQSSPTSEEIQVVDSSGNIVASPLLFKGSVKLNDESGKRVYAKWGECVGGYEVVDGVCTPKTFTVTFNKDSVTSGTSSITVAYMSLLPTITPPTKAGYAFNGYYNSSNTQIYTNSGTTSTIYEMTENITLNAKFTECSAGTFNAGDKTTCTVCAYGSYAQNSGSVACTACTPGHKNSNSTNNASNRTSCTSTCTNYSNATEWFTTEWNSDNTVNNLCKAKTCKDGYEINASNYCAGYVYNIRYILDGGTLSNPKTSAAYGTEFSLARPTRDGYTFEGWNLVSGFNSSTAQYYYQSPSTEEWRPITSSSTIIKIYTYFKDLTKTDKATVYMHANWSPSGSSGLTYITCEAGKYIKQGETQCNTTCPSGYYCPGGKYVSGSDQDEGIIKCQERYTSDSGAKNPDSCYDPSICLSGDTEIEVYDKKKKKRYKKKIKDLTYDDLVLAWDFDKGQYVWAQILWIMKKEKSNTYHLLTFSDGSTLKVIGGHRIFSCEENRFVSCLKMSLGSTTINSKGEVVELVSRKELTGEVDVCNIITKDHINVFANGILTSRGRNNIYKIENMKFVKEEGERFTREDFPEVSDEYYYGLRLGDTLKTYRGKENFTRESLSNLVKRLEETKEEKK